MSEHSNSEEKPYQIVRLKRSEILFKQGSIGSNFYIIQKGLIELQFDGKTRRLLKEGAFFGEIGPLAELPRTATATALASSELLEYTTHQFHRMLRENADLANQIFSKFHGRLLQHSTRQEKHILFANDSVFEDFLKNFHLKEVPENTILCREGETHRSLYFLRRGRIAVIKAGETISEAQPGDFVGEISAVFGIPRTATLQTLSPVELLECSGSSVGNVLEKFNIFREHLMDLASRRMRR